MKKSFLFWSGIILGVVLVGALLIFLGHEPESRDIIKALPEANEGEPYLFTVCDGSFFNSELEDFLFEYPGNDTPVAPFIKAISPLASKAEKVAFIAYWEHNRITFMATLKLPFEDLQVLSAGKFPGNWKDIKDVRIEKREDGVLYLAPPAIREPMMIKRDGGLLLVAGSREDLSLMSRTLSGEVKPIDLHGVTLYGKRDNFLKIHDAGLVSQMALLYGISTTPGNITLLSGWDSTDSVVEMEWRIKGLDEVFPEELLARLKPFSWNNPLILPDPVLFAFGVNTPDLRGQDYEALGLSGIEEDLEMEPEDLMSVLEGPTVLTVAGESKFILFQLPGMLLQLQERGMAGKELIRKFWTSKWRAFVPSIEEVQGYDTGGSANLPLSILGVANDEMAAAGFLVANESTEMGLPGKMIPFLRSDDKALLWFFIDGPGLSDKLEQITRAGELAEKLGSDLGQRTADIIEAAEKLEQLGKVSLVMQTLDRGILFWDGSRP